MERPIVYELHPVSRERKAELLAEGFRIIDAKYRPSVSFGGVNYAVENGVVEVAEEAVQYLHQYGFVVPAGDKPSDARPKQAGKADA
jgi:hypothetical protein